MHICVCPTPYACVCEYGFFASQFACVFSFECLTTDGRNPGLGGAEESMIVTEHIAYIIFRANEDGRVVQQRQMADICMRGVRIAPQIWIWRYRKTTVRSRGKLMAKGMRKDTYTHIAHAPTQNVRKYICFSFLSVSGSGRCCCRCRELQIVRWQTQCVWFLKQQEPDIKAKAAEDENIMFGDRICTNSADSSKWTKNIFECGVGVSRGEWHIKGY